MNRGLRAERRLRFSVHFSFALCLLGLSANLFASQDIAYDGKHVCEGIEYFHKQVPDVPWSIHVVRIERARSDFQLLTTMPTNRAVGLTLTTEQLKAIPPSVGEPIAAINGDFFSWPKGAYQGDPAGLQIIDGEMVSAPPHSRESMIHGSPANAVCFWTDAKGNIRIDKVASNLEVTFPNGAKLPVGLNQNRTNTTAVLYTSAAGSSTRMTNGGVELVLEKNGGDWLPLVPDETYSARVRNISSRNTPINADTLVLSIGDKLLAKLPKLKKGMAVRISTVISPELKHATAAIGGGPQLVHDGKLTKIRDDKRNPRTAVGYSKTHLYFFVVDGRRKGISDGMTFEELAKEIAWWGCDEAMNLDGGGSATIWVDGKIMNQPSDNKERAVANDLVVVRKR
ncbi:MAG: metallophosphoesterase [Verrucomicrobiales bacterium]|nr:metallophosphoesterase [Verrucomicrobiales bacterium]